MIRLLAALVLALAAIAYVQAPARAQVAFDQAPAFDTGAAYDAAIPAPRAVLGHDLGQRITPSAEVHRYFEALQAAAPDRMRIGRYATTHQGRTLLWAVIGSPRNIARLDRIQAAAQALADPRRTTPVQAQALMADQPAIVWLGHSVHGNEISPAESAMAVARHLLAAPNDPVVRAILDNTLVFIVPTQNPDGRERFIAGYAAAAGIQIDPDPLSAERAERWPSGRVNTALFDLNRDWFAQTQPETRGHSALMRGWRPHVVVDAHEMGSESTFFFPPEAEPHNPLLPARQMAARDVFGRNTAAWFDRAGLDYFTREVFDAFYPGYGDAWPSYLGAVSMTYEQASSRGLAARRSDGSVLTYADTVRGHFTAAMATLETAARERPRLLAEQYAHYRDAVAKTGGWLLPRIEADPGAADRLAELLALQGVEVLRLDAGAVCGQTLSLGGYAIAEGQPLGPLARVLFDASVQMRPGFIEEQERRRAQGLGAEIYDVTAWSLPLAFNTPAVACRALPAGGGPLEPGVRRSGSVSGPADAAVWVIPAGTQAFRFMTAALREGLRLRAPEQGFTLGGRAYAAGSLIVTRGGNPADVADKVRRIAQTSGADVVASPDTWVTDGPSLGSGRAPALKAARVALAWDEGVSATSAGSVRHVLEREYGYPVTVVAARNLAGADLSRFDVVILPDGSYSRSLGESGMANLRGWVQRGGVLIGLAGGAEALADPKARLLSARLETRAGDDDKPGGSDDEATVAGSLLDDETAYRARLAGGDRALDEVAGAFLGASVDPDHWLGAGVQRHVSILYGGSSVFRPLTLDQGVNVVRFDGADRLVEAGQLWSENRRQLAFKPAVMVEPVGGGQVIAFAQDPTLRGFLRGLDGLLLNAIFRGASR